VGVKTWLSWFALTTVACSSSGTWRRIETPHFLLYTDLGSSDAKRAGAALETTRDALVSAAWPHFRFKEVQTHVYVLANGLDFEHYFGRKTGGLFLHSSPAMFFLYGSPSRWELRRSAHRPDDSVLRHEMAHELSAEVWPSQPRWFSEGFANFLEPVFYADDEKSVVLGGINFGALSDYRRVRTTTVADALQWKDGLASLSTREAMGLYGVSWLFVHWLYHNHPDKLTSYFDHLSQGGDPDEALKAALPELDTGAIDRELNEYQRHGRFDDIVLPLIETPIVESALPEHVLTPAEVTDVKEILTKVGKAHTTPSHAEDGDGEATKWEGPDVSARPAPPPRKKIDYSALPTLPQYPCGGTEDAISAKGGNAAEPAKTRTASTSKSRDRATTPAKTPVSGRVVNGRLPSEVIQKIVRAGYKELEYCYKNGLRKNADLGGRVTMRFFIEVDGSVSEVQPTCTTLPDPITVKCMADRFAKYQFPKPEGGVVSVTYPIMFTPTD